MPCSLPPSIDPAEVSWKFLKCFLVAGASSRKFESRFKAAKASWLRFLKLATTHSATLMSCSADIPHSISSGERDCRICVPFTSRLAAWWHPVRFPITVLPPRATGRMWSTSKKQMAKPFAYRKRSRQISPIKLTKNCVIEILTSIVTTFPQMSSLYLALNHSGMVVTTPTLTGHNTGLI